MYLFGFPEGLAGGSKETEYATNLGETSHTTIYQTSQLTPLYTSSRQTSADTINIVTTYPIQYPTNSNWSHTIGTGTLPIETAYGSYVDSRRFYIVVRQSNGGWANVALQQCPNSTNTPTSIGSGNTVTCQAYNGWRAALSSVHSSGKFYISIFAKNGNTHIANGTAPIENPVTVNTSWTSSWGHTPTWTSWNTDGFTNYQTTRLTSHITYG